MSTVTPTWKQPSHPDLLKLVSQPGDFASLSISQVDLSPGSLLTRLNSPPIMLASKAYSTVQISANQHVELNCDFLFTNHSCEPSLEFVIVNVDHDDDRNGIIEKRHQICNSYAIDIRVAVRKDIDGNVIGLRQGDELTFFYPSTEWDMGQPFKCSCSTKSCKGMISGAKDMSSTQMTGYFLNAHIWDLIKLKSKGQ